MEKSKAHDPGGYSHDGLNAGDRRLMSTWSGRWVDPLNVRPEDVCAEDVARALSRTCRYNGHTAGHLSVARHSLWVLEEVRGGGRDLELWALLHDASEAYLGDLPRPLKLRRRASSAYRRAERRCEKAVAVAFGLPAGPPPEVKAADRAVLVNRELHDLRWTWDSTAEEDEALFLDHLEKLEG